MNTDHGPAEAYHWAHTHIRNQLSAHFLDFANYPKPVKEYDKGIGQQCQLPEPYNFFNSSSELNRDTSIVDVISRALYLAYGVTAARKASGISFFQRSLPSAGGLYPCHLYLAACPSLFPETDTHETGLYYFDPVNHILVKTGSGPFLNSPGLLFIITAAFYNSAWKYRGRAYRYLLLDSGHLIQNIGLALKIAGMDYGMDLDFDDTKISALLNLDNKMEVPLACVAAGWNKSVPEMSDNTQILSHSQFDKFESRSQELQYMQHYNTLIQAYEAGSNIKSSWPDSLPGDLHVTDSPALNTITITDAGSGDTSPNKNMFQNQPRYDLENLILRRRSRRNFAKEHVASNQYLELVSWVRQGIWEKNKFSADRFLRMGMICQNLEGLDDGFYLFNTPLTKASLLHSGNLASDLAKVCLDQAWIARAAMTFLFLSDLKELEDQFGSRGYRYMMTGAGRLAHQIYLGAEHLGFGCCGIGAIYDMEAKELLNLRAHSALVYAVSAGPLKAGTKIE
ncbi:MAG: SagB family peptide dehydrogenase [Desulfobacterales bacterium]|nr:SagB family peptide dehydrogenase [Desulfobacterales bacterium]